MKFISKYFVVCIVTLFLASYASMASASTVADSSQIVIDPTGNAVAIWQYNSGNLTEIQSSTLPFGGVWSATTTISSFGVNSYAPILAINSSGDVVALWSYDDTVGNNIRLASATLPSLGAWSVPVTLTGPTESLLDLKNGVDNPNYKLAMNNNGTIVATWTVYLLTGDLVICTAHASFGGAWTVPVQLSP